MTIQAHHLIRSRWAALGAAVAVTLGAGGLVSVSATSPESVFVAITPTRALDTRIDVGFAQPLTTGVARELDVTGSIPIVGPTGAASTGSPVPDGATAVSLNVTAVRPSALGHIAVRPGGATGSPTTSNVNINSPSGVWPNAVTVEVGANGAINLFYFGNQPGATTEMLVDIVGYYVQGQGVTGPAGPAGPAGPTGPEGPAGPRGVSAWDAIPSGVMVTGEWTIDDVIDVSTPLGQKATGRALVELPAKAPVALTQDAVKMAEPSSADHSALCTGNVSAPTAPPGMVCVYWSGTTYGSSADLSAGLSTLTSQTFTVSVRSNSATSANIGREFGATGTWAYTAP